MSIINLAVLVAILGISFACLYKNKDWATRLHQYYISESEKHWYGKLFPWENPWIIWLFRILIIFFSIVFLIVAYPFAFGTIYF